MNRADFEAHAVWNTIDITSSLLARIDQSADDMTASRLNELRWLRATSEAAQEVDQIFLVSTSSMNALSESWDAVNGQLHSYLESPVNNVRQFQLATGSSLDSVRAALRELPSSEKAASKKGAMTRAISAFEEQVERSRSALVEELKDQQEKFEDATETQATANEALEDERKKLAESYQTLQRSIESDELRLASAIDEKDQAFRESEEARLATFKAWLDEKETDFGDLAQPYVDSLIADARRAEALREKISGITTTVVDLANLAAGDVLGGQYEASAKTERRAGYTGYGIGLVTALLGIPLVIWAFGSLNDGVDWTQAALKLGLTTAVGGVAAVAFRFGSQSLARATSYKRQELELRALTPFLQDVEGSDEAKLAFVRQAFGKAWEQPGREGNDAGDTLSHSDLLKALQSLAKQRQQE